MIENINEKDLKKLEKFVSDKKENYRREQLEKVYSCDNFSLATDGCRIGLIYHNDKKSTDHNFDKDSIVNTILKAIPTNFDFEIVFNKNDFLNLLKNSLEEFTKTIQEFENIKKLNKNKICVVMDFVKYSNDIKIRLDMLKEIGFKFYSSVNYNFETENEIKNDLKIGISYKFLIDMFNFLNKKEKDLTIKFNGAASPIFAEEENKNMVIYPIRVRE